MSELRQRRYEESGRSYLRELRRDGAQHVGQQQLDGALVQLQLGQAQPGGHVAARGQAAQRAAAQRGRRPAPEGAPRALHRDDVQRRHRLQELRAVLPDTRHTSYSYPISASAPGRLRRTFYTARQCICKHECTLRSLAGKRSSAQPTTAALIFTNYTHV